MHKLLSFTAFLQARSCETRMRMVRSLYARSKLEKYHESTNVYRQKIYFPKAKVRQWGKVETKTKPQKLARRVCSHEKKGLRSRQKGLHLTKKKVSPHERKLPTWIFTRPLVVLVRTLFVIFAFLIQALGTLKDQPLRVG